MYLVVVLKIDGSREEYESLGYKKIGSIYKEGRVVSCKKYSPASAG